MSANTGDQEQQVGGIVLTPEQKLSRRARNISIVVGVALLVVLARKLRPLERRASVAIHAAFGTQILLGIATVWSGMAIWLAALHQLTGALLLSATIWGSHILGRPQR